MEDYLKKLDYYINLKVRFIDNNTTIYQELKLKDARAEMEEALLLLIKKSK